MYTIIMTSNKQLVTTVTTTIYQREKLVDKIQLLFPPVYDDLDLTECTAKFVYMDQANVAHTEVLEKDEELYKDKLRFCFPVDTSITKFSGDIVGHVTFTMINEDDQEVYVLHTSDTTISVAPLADYYAFVNDESLEVIDQKMIELEARIEAATVLAESIDENKADSLVVEDSKLSLTANGQKIGDEVAIVVPDDTDTSDENEETDNDQPGDLDEDTPYKD